MPDHINLPNGISMSPGMLPLVEASGEIEFHGQIVPVLYFPDGGDLYRNGPGGLVIQHSMLPRDFVLIAMPMEVGMRIRDAMRKKKEEEHKEKGIGRHHA